MVDQHADDESVVSFLQIPGDSVAEKAAFLGLHTGSLMKLSDLWKIHETYGIEVYLFFDERIARHSTMKDDIRDFAILPQDARPYLEIGRFLRVVKEQQIPLPDVKMLNVEVIAVSELEHVVCCSPQNRPFIRAFLLPE
jgi:hypothetical protein